MQLQREFGLVKLGCTGTGQVLTRGLSQFCSLAWGSKGEWDHMRGLAPLSHTKHAQIHSKVTKEFRLSRDHLLCQEQRLVHEASTILLLSSCHCSFYLIPGQADWAQDAGEI